MQLPYATVAIDVSCSWGEIPPRYRIFVDDEMFIERTFIWRNDFYLEEHITVTGPPARYQIRCINVDPELGEFKFKNIRMVDSNDNSYVRKNILELRS